MPERILVPFDGSERSEQALEFAFESFPGAAVTVLHVVEIPAEPLSHVAPDLRPPMAEKAEEFAEDLLESATDLADDHGRSITTEVDRGVPDHRIVERAADGDFDLIVIGCHGRDGVSASFLGTVAEKVVRRSPIPVVVAR